MKIIAVARKFFRLRLVAVLGIALSMSACSDKEKADEIFSPEIRSNIPAALIDKVRQMGVKVNEGTKPPLFQGTYWLSPNVMTKTDVPNDSYVVGQVFVNYKINLYNQDNNKLTMSLDTKGYSSNGTEVSNSVGQDGAYISGNGKFFTVFVISEGKFTYNTSKYKMLEVYSGEITSAGIKNLQNAILMMDNYGNINDDLIPNETGRAFKDDDGLSEVLSSFRLTPSNETEVGTGHTARIREQMLVIKK